MEPCNSDFKMKMAKRFRLRLSRAVPSFQSCRPKEPAALPSYPPTRTMSSNSNHFTSAEATSSSSSSSSPLCSSSSSSCPLSYSHIMRQLVTVFTSMGCGSSRSCSTTFIPVEGGQSQTEVAADKLPENYFQWLKDEKWLVVAKLCHEDDGDSAPRRKIYLDSTPLFPRLLISEDRARKKRLQRLKEEKGVERERLVESVSSSSSNRHNENDSYCYDQRSSRRKSSEYENGSPLSMTPPRLSRFQWLIPCAVEGKVRESFAVVQTSEDPYEDFKKSMLEMVVEKRMFDRDDLERLLNCFLSLNSEDHHGVIVEAFSEVWRTLFAP